AEHIGTQHCGHTETPCAETQKAGATVFSPPADSMFYQYRARLVRLAANTRLPAMWGLRDQAEARGLMAYSSLNDLARRAATYVDKILKGAKPADLPVEQPTKFELVINVKTAKALDLTIPQILLQRADRLLG